MSEKVPDLIFRKIFKNVFLSCMTIITLGGGVGWRSCDFCVFILQADVPSTEAEEEQSEQAAQ